MKKHQVLLITNIPTPYRIPLFNELNSQLDAQGISFKVVFAALTYPRRKWAIEMSQCTFPYVVLNSRRLMSKNPESAIFTYYGLGQILRDNPNALLITSGFSLATIRIYLRSLYRRTNYLIWSGAINRKGRPDSWLRNFQRRRMISRASGFIAYGKRAHNYLVDLGADRSRIFIGINTIDTTYFFRESSRLRLENGSKDSLTKSILYIGNLETGKRLDYLLKAVHLLAGSRNDFRLEIVGTGSQEVHLKQLAQRLGIGHLVCFHGFAQQDTVVRYLSKAFCFAFPSEYDVWGLVLIEALASGVPCVSSIDAGATGDLIQDGMNGFAVDFSQPSLVADKLAWLMDHPVQTRAMGLNAARFATEQLSLITSAAEFVGAIQACLGNRHAVA